MRTLPALAALVLIGGPAAAQAAPSFSPQPSITLPAELDRVLRDYERAWQAGDEVALVALFTADGFVPARQGWLRGSEAIRSNYASSQGPLRLRAHAYATADSVGYIVGAYAYGDSAGPPDGGKFVLALRRGAGGKWLIAADLDQSTR
ncbi:MAG: YybH family protein [Gemmatimonadales bacterium]